MWFASFGSIAMSLTMFLYGAFVRLESLIEPKPVCVVEYACRLAGRYPGFGAKASFRAPVVVVRECDQTPRSVATQTVFAENRIALMVVDSSSSPPTRFAIV